MLRVALIGAALGVAIVRRSGKGGLFRPGEGFFGGLHIPWLAYDPALTAHWPTLTAAFLGIVIFSLYWEIAARNAAESKSAESTASRGVHVFLTNAALLLEILPIRGLGRMFPASIAIMSAGLAAEALGLALAIWARRHLGRNWSGRISIKVGHELIRSGPYRRLRHPIYTGIIGLYAGMALVTGEWLACIGLALCVLAYWRKIRLEESALHGAFGPAYADYRRGTWALVPGLY